MNSLDYLKSMIKYHKEPSEIKDEVPICNIYKVIEILDKYKYNEDIRKIYKANFDYERDRNSISLIFTIHNYKRSKNFHSLIQSEFIQDMFKELKECNTTKSFYMKIKNEKNYSFSLHGDTAIYKTPYFNVKRF